MMGINEKDDFYQIKRGENEQFSLFFEEIMLR